MAADRVAALTDKIFRLASWNIRKAIGRDFRRNPARVLAAIATLRADIVLLQEADLRFRGRGALFAAEEILERTGLAPVQFADAHAGLGWHGNVMLVRGDLEIRHKRIVHLKSLEPRGAIEADVILDGASVRILGAHLALVGAIRRVQASVIARGLPTGRPAIVAGDFNAWPGAGWSLAPLASRLSLAATGPSFPASRPLVDLDRIFTSRGLRVSACGVERFDPVARASDHLPIWADVMMVNE